MTLQRFGLALLLCAGFAHAAPVTVLQGDTLPRIAARLDTTVPALQAANPGLNPARLRAGQVLQSPRAAPPVHMVRGGDTLSALARRQGATVADIVALNPGLDPQAALRVGQRLTLPRAGRASTVRPAATVRAASVRVSAVLPVQGRLTSTFGPGHGGVDLAAPTGTPVRAARPGTVTESRFDARTGWGWTVVVDHGDGMVTRYSHNSANLVAVGASVPAGQTIALVGSTGNSTGPHLDFRVTVRGDAVDPLGLY